MKLYRIERLDGRFNEDELGKLKKMLEAEGKASKVYASKEQNRLGIRRYNYGDTDALIVMETGNNTILSVLNGLTALGVSFKLWVEDLECMEYIDDGEN